LSVRRKGRGWEIRFQHAGRPFSRSVRGTRAEAQRAEREYIGRLERGAATLPRFTIEDALIRWLEGEAKALRSYENLRTKTRQLLPYAGEPLERAGEVAERIKTDGVARGLAPATINRRLAILRRVARLAFEEWKWVDRPVRVRLLPGERPRYVQASAGQIRELLAHCHDPRLRDALLLAVLTGLRQGELLALRPDQVSDGRILLDARTKTGRPRSIPLAPEAQGIVARLPLALTYAELRSGWEAARKAAALPGLQWRDLRRTFGSWIVQSTGSLKAAQDLLGHTSMQITARHYAHLLDEHLEAAIGGLPTLGKKLGKNPSKSARSIRKNRA